LIFRHLDCWYEEKKSLHLLSLFVCILRVAEEGPIASMRG